MSLTEDILFVYAVELFNMSKYFDCHEILEEIWTHSVPPQRLFLQSLIHFAVALHHHQNRNAVGASRQLRKGLLKMEAYLPEWRGFPTAAVQREMHRCLDIIEAGGVIDEPPMLPPHTWR
jgi:uncharacterized protein